MNYDLVQTITRDNLHLSGLYIEGDKNKSAVILIHGFTSDFYSHKFFHTIQESLNNDNFASVAIQTRGTGLHTEFLKGDDGIFLGSYYEKLEEAHYDISGWINFLMNEGYSRFILAGHSLGTLKSVRYLFEGEYKDSVEKLVLLAPFDKNGYIERKTNGLWHDHLKIAKKKIEEGKEEELVTKEAEDYSITFRTYYSWYVEEDLNLIWDFYRKDYLSPILQKIKIPVKIIVGSDDEFFYIKELGSTFESTSEYLKSNIENLDLFIVQGAGHIYNGYEDEVADEVLKFIK